MTLNGWKVEALRQCGGWVIAFFLLYAIVYFIMPKHQEEMRKLEEMQQRTLNRIELKIDKLDVKLDR